MQYDSLDELLGDLPALAQQHRQELAGRTALFLFELKEGRRVYVALQDGVVTLPGSSSAAPDATIIAAECDLLAMVAGQMNPMAALMRGKVKVKGNAKALLELIALIK